MNMKLIFSMLILSIITSCASNPNKVYAQVDVSDNVVLHGSEQVVKSVVAIPLPKTSSSTFSLLPKSFKINEQDAIIDFDEFKGSYKLFEFGADRGDSFTIKLASMCDCFGFNKQILVPIAYVVNKRGVAVKTDTTNIVNRLGFISFSLKGDAPENGKYYLVVAANNGKPGSKSGVGEAKIDGYKPTGIMLSNRSHPYGKIIPSYTLENANNK